MHTGLTLLGIELPASGVLVANPNTWEELAREARKLVHAADYWEPAEMAKGVSMADVRSLHDFASRSSFGGKKLAVLWSADTFRVEVANALLKLLEEPPAGLSLLLLAQSERLLPTLRSRLRLLSLPSDYAIMVPEERAETDRQKWAERLATYELTDPQQRERARELLFLHSLMHSSIKTETVLDSLKDEFPS